MMENEQVEVEEQEFEAVETGEEGQQEEPAGNPEAEEEARKYGWRPKEEFDRDPEGWVDAERFLELPSTHKKMLKDELRERDKALEDYKRRMDRLEKANKMALDTALEQQRSQYERELQQVRMAQRKAVEEGDTERWDRLEQYKERLEPPKPPELEPEQPGPDPFLEEYSARPEGQWLNDPYMRQRAAEIVDAHKGVAGKSAQEQVAFAEAKLREYYPHKFEQPKQPRQRVDGGGLAGGKARSSASKLPPEAQKAAKDFVAQGIFKSVDEYAQVYFEQEG